MAKWGKITRQLLLGGALSAAMMVLASPAAAREQLQRRFDIGSQDLGDALRTVARESGREIMFSADAVEGRRGIAIHGKMTADQAIEALLQGSDLVADFRDEVVLVRGRSTTATATPDAAQGAQIVVTGSRIRGAETPSPIATVTQLEMLRAGQSNLGDVIRSLPQNFGGGQNPGLGITVPIGVGVDLTGGNSLNLRGLGSDATLTLLNGHRLVYGSNVQSIDLSTIPLQAVDRLEILADGASAIYGSDAVAGVANVILKRDFDGLASTVEYGAATDGGFVRQHYSLVGGRRWDTGGVLVTYDLGLNTAILSRQRGYSLARSPGLTLYPRQRQHAILASGHQDILADLTLSFDATFGRRFSTRSYAVSATANPLIVTNPSRSHTFTFSPRLDLSLPGDWRVSAQGVIGSDNARFDQLLTQSGVATRVLRGCVCNQARTIELAGDGPLFSIGGEPARIAVGAGYRYSRFLQEYEPAGIAETISPHQDVYYGFGELSVPLVSPDRNIPLLRRLMFNAAVRVEDYVGIEQVATPKLGLIYAPSADIDIKGTWGKSFKAPTLSQLYRERFATIYSAASRSGVGYPSTATIIEQSGGSPDLTPERARTWSATVTAHPRAVPGLRLEATFFHIRYKDRVTDPIPFPLAALTLPYADYVQLNPSDADKAAALAGRSFFNNTTQDYDAANVVAIVRNNSVNAARQTIKGVDLSGRYHFALGDMGSVTLTGSGSYLDSEQQITITQPVQALSGVLYNPPHWKARGSASWDHDGLTLSGLVNYIGGVRDEQIRPFDKIRGMTTADFVASYHSEGSGPLGNVDVTLSVQNAFNVHPGLIRTRFVFDPGYDSTNYSPIDRYVSLSVSKTW